MKKNVFLMVTILTILFTSACNNKKNNNTDWLLTDEPVSVDVDDIYTTRFFLEGNFFLDGELGGETSPTIRYCFHQDYDFYVWLILLTSSPVDVVSNSTGVPVELVIKVRDIVKKTKESDYYSFWTDDNGWVWIGYYLGPHEENPLDSALELLGHIEKETTWFISKEKWEARKVH
jgi:hypothetical protein